jgi:hypothetical protein
MLYLDYNWDLSPSGILLDNELNTDGLNWHPGDVFVLEETANGRLVIKKQTGVSKFILEGVIKKDGE